MKIAVIGAGAMGSVVGGLLSAAGNDVSLVDVSEPAVNAINRDGLALEGKGGEVRRIPVRATSRPAEVGPVDLVLVFVKCYHTEAAVRAGAALIGPKTKVLSLQNGWGNGPRIAQIVGRERVLLGVCYHSAVVVAPGHVRHVGQGPTFVGNWQSEADGAADAIAASFANAGVPTTVAPDVVREIWSKLALNVCTLPVSSLLRFESRQLVEHEATRELMSALLHEMVGVAKASRIALDYDERWSAITGLLQRCGPGAKSSMLQDVENRRRTEIDVINGAIVAAGRETGIAVPRNETLVSLIRALEASFVPAPVVRAEGNR